MNIVVIGIGLIGGSLAKDLRPLAEQGSLLGIDSDAAHLQKAVELGLVDGRAGESDLLKADLVVLSIPVNHIVSELPRVLDQIGEETLVIDAGSTKGPICKVVDGHPRRRNFMACHPIAGTEFTGPEAAVAGLFKGKVNIICEVEQTAFKIQERGLEIFQLLGMRIRYMHPEAHDRHIAYVSHLSHISSFMLGKTVIEKEQNERDIFDMAGSGFESTVRLAKSSPAMWTPIFEQNRENVLETLSEYIANLEAFRAKLEQNRYEDLFKQMDHTNRIKDILKGIPLNKQ